MLTLSIGHRLALFIKLTLRVCSIFAMRRLACPLTDGKVRCRGITRRGRSAGDISLLRRRDITKCDTAFMTASIIAVNASFAIVSTDAPPLRDAAPEKIACGNN